MKQSAPSKKKEISRDTVVPHRVFEIPDVLCNVCRWHMQPTTNSPKNLENIFYRCVNEECPARHTLYSLDIPNMRHVDLRKV